MKRLFLPAVILFFLCACTKTAGETKPDFCMNGCFTVTYMQTDYSFAASTDADGTLEMKITEPENIAGVAVICGADGMTAECGEVRLDCGTGYIPFTSFYKVLSFAENSEPSSVTAGGNETRIEYANGNDKYVFTVKNETGEIIKINTPMCEYIKR